MPTARPATLVDDTTPIELVRPARFVSRGGEKLDAALEAFGVDVAGRRALDAGASTGGFTDALLQRGASEVVAVDVGYGQLDWSIASDARVRVVDRTNVRHLDPATVGGPFDVVVADLSFISLRTVADRLVAALAPDGDLVVLVKPQFEVGRDRVGRGGVVRDPAARADALVAVARRLEELGLGVQAAMASPITGAKGNVEYLLWARRGPGMVDEDDLRRLADGDGDGDRKGGTGAAAVEGEVGDGARHEPSGVPVGDDDDGTRGER